MVIHYSEEHRNRAAETQNNVKNKQTFLLLWPVSQSGQYNKYSRSPFTVMGWIFHSKRYFTQRDYEQYGMAVLNCKNTSFTYIAALLLSGFWDHALANILGLVRIATLF
jgi:hypothetical protein